MCQSQISVLRPRGGAKGTSQGSSYQVVDGSARWWLILLESRGPSCHLRGCKGPCTPRSGGLSSSGGGEAQGSVLVGRQGSRGSGRSGFQQGGSACAAGAGLRVSRASPVGSEGTSSPGEPSQPLPYCTIQCTAGNGGDAHPPGAGGGEP